MCKAFAMLGAALVCQLLVAQNPADLFSKAPPYVDEALRARITKFYQAMVEGKARQGEQYVAEDSKDIYYDMAKPKYLSFEIHDIHYSDDFTKAKAVIVVQTFAAVPGFQSKPLPMPIGSLWKVVDGQWYWYVDPESLKITPFGKMTPGPYPAGTPGAPQAMPDPSKGFDLGALWKQVHVDKRIVQLKAGEASSDQVTISSDVQAVISLQLQRLDMPGLELKLDRTELKPGEKAILSFRFEPHGEALHPVVANLLVQPIGYLIPIQIKFQ
jgi:hypothetical protein